MNVNISRLRRVAYGALALAVLGAVAIPALNSKVFAAQATNRYIQLNNSTPTAPNTIYKVGFTVSNVATNIGGIAIDFCSNSPILGDTCTPPTGFLSSYLTLTVANQTNISGLTVDTSASTNNKVILTKTAAAPTSAAVSFELGNGTTTGLTNPTPVSTSASQGTFYARIYSYTTTAAAQAHSTTAPTGYTDFGGVAMSTASVITVTAKVQETLTFCVYTGANCTAGGTAVTLGDTNGVLSTAGPYVDNTTKYDVATNAGGTPATTIRFKAPLPTSGANTIATIGTTGTASVTGSSQFGLCSWRSSGTLLLIQAPYDNGNTTGGICSGTTQSAGTGTPGGTNSALFAFNTANAASTYGETLATTSAGATSTGKIAFIGNVSATQAAGIYASPFIFVATPTY